MEAQTGFAALVTTVVRDEVARFVRERLAELSRPPAESGGRKVNVKTKGLGQRRKAAARRCTICGSPGHNARGHEKATAAQDAIQPEAADETAQS